jgi:hypothetical protein
MLTIQTIGEITDEIRRHHRHDSADDGGIIIAILPGDDDILGAGQWLVPVRHLLPSWGKVYFYDFIPPGWEEWAETEYPFSDYCIGEWF